MQATAATIYQVVWRGDRKTNKKVIRFERLSVCRIAEKRRASCSNLIIMIRKPAVSVDDRYSRYDLLTTVGKGSYGVVIKAGDTWTGQLVAIKHIGGIFNSCATDMKRGLREMYLLRQCRHPCIIELVTIVQPSCITSSTSIDLVIPYMAHDLQHVLRNHRIVRDWNTDTVELVIFQLLAGVAFLHAHGILHRDIKPANILLDEQYKVKICDFGLARIDDSEQREHKPKRERRMSRHVVTRWYRAPELILLSDSYSHPVDMWSVGCVLGELLLSLQHRDVGPLFPGAASAMSDGLLEEDDKRDGLLAKDDKRDGLSEEDDMVDYFNVEFQKDYQLQKIFNVIGTPTNEEVDMLAGFDTELKQKIKHALLSVRKCGRLDFNFHFSETVTSSPGLLELIEGMLRFNPSERMSANEALSNPVFEPIVLQRSERGEQPIHDFVQREIRTDFEKVNNVDQLKQLLREEVVRYKNKTDDAIFEFEEGA